MVASEAVEWAMFPLETAFLPDQDLPLRIFEPRYGALVRHCISTAEPFGVVMISRGREVGGGDVRSDVGVLTRIEDYVDHGAGQYQLRCRTGERIRVREWLPDDPFPRASVELWPDEPADPVTDADLDQLEDQVMALFERIAEVRGIELPARDVVLGHHEQTGRDAGQRLYALAARVPTGTADRYSVLAAPSAAERLVALREAVESVAAVVEFQLSE